MKVLVSAFACNPYQGSEPGVGWMAVKNISTSHDVYLLTDSHNREGLYRAKSEGIIPENVQIKILREDTTYSKNRFVARIQSWMWYVSYCKMVLKEAMDWHNEVKFDLCHQVTIATWRMPSPLWKLPIPFIWGPIGGAGSCPRHLRATMSFKARIFEFARDMQTFFSLHSKAFRECIRNTSVVIFANEETEKFLLPARGELPSYRLPVVPITKEKFDHFRRIRQRPKSKSSKPLLIFAGGNIMGTKGISLAIQALNIARHKGIDFRYTIAGGGPEISKIKSLVHDLGLDDRISFHPGYENMKYAEMLHQCDVFLLPSMRETLGMTMIEAIMAGCYPIVIDISAQGEVVKRVGGYAVPVGAANEMVRGLAQRIEWCSLNRNQLIDYANSAPERCYELLKSENYNKLLKMAYSDAMNTRDESA